MGNKQDDKGLTLGSTAVGSHDFVESTPLLSRDSEVEAGGPGVQGHSWLNSESKTLRRSWLNRGILSYELKTTKPDRGLEINLCQVSVPEVTVVLFLLSFCGGWLSSGG